ncbi:MDR family MFS transporter [Streptomyces sp. UNOB3_S3]|uniref:MDR family MFS transporter n=1 Tax=Streptomyces sp. UNOB3_S3 TaxID=2871682 RepID=UPI001E42BF59|nr:MDR family MFS transporter [Streptomyces sp. UNOB3_S3]MCC3774368.1 MFS transporter [Streptomyces sp. UNOB3_S3]
MTVILPLMLALFVANLDQTIVTTALPSIGRDLHGTTGDVSWIATAYLLTSAVTTLVFGKLGDMYGRKGIFQLSLVVFLCGSLLSATAGSVPYLALSRALQGIGGGSITSLVMAITGDLAAPRQRARQQALLGMAAALALVAGPLLGGAFADGLSWRWIFYVNLPIGAVALAVVALRLRLPRPETPAGRVDVLGTLVVTVFTTSVVLVTTWGGHRYPWGSPVILALIALGAASLALYLFVERGAVEPVTPPRLFRRPVFSLASAEYLITGMVLFAAMLYVPTFLQMVQHKSAFGAGLFVIPMLLGMVAAAALSGPVIARTGRYKLYPVTGAVLAGGAMAVVSRAGPHTTALWLVVPLTVTGVGLGLFIQVALLAGQNTVAYEDVGSATAVLNFCRTLGGAFGTALFGAILTAGLHSPRPGAAESASAFHTVFEWTVPFMAVAFVLALAMREEPLSERQ